MYFNRSFTLTRANYKTSKEFLQVVKYYLKEYKGQKDIEITINKDVSITFIGKNHTYFY